MLLKYLRDFIILLTISTVYISQKIRMGQNGSRPKFILQPTANIIFIPNFHLCIFVEFKESTPLFEQP